jgi:hypothetical protein
VSAEQARIFDVLERARDPYVWFVEVFGITPNPAQKRWLKLIRPDKPGWEWRYKVVCHVAANQIGKSLGLALLILWAAWYKIGIDTDDRERWQGSAYAWYHLAPSQQQAYIPLRDIILLLAGAHGSQARTGAYKRVLAAIRPLISEVKIEQYYDGLELWNGSQIQFRTTEDKAKALQGRRANGISYDECAFEDHLKSVINETLLMRLISTGGPLWLVSTPNGINDWYEIVVGIQENSVPQREAEPDEIGGSVTEGELSPLWNTPDGWALVWSTVADNIGFGIDAAEAARMERDLDPSTKEQQLRGAFLEPADAYFVPSSIIDKAFTPKLPESTPPIPGHRYIISWDPSAQTDPTVVVVIDISKLPWRGVHFEYFARPLGESALISRIYELHAYYNGGATPQMKGVLPPRAITTWDSTSMGGALIGQTLVALTPKVPFNLAGPNAKNVALMNLRAALSTGKLKLPTAWARVRREVLTYKLPDDKIRQDCVMALAGAVALAAKGWSGNSAAPLSPRGRATLRKR